ncbi:ATP-binding protein [Kineococcus sp. NBC_00420]|uniref:ATP-binding protein n=1 Tax=Kineococcus sp. NBC_00420 TaxID=2903564 RepID=UPI002E1AFD0F
MCTTTRSSRASLPATLTSGRLARRFLNEHWCTPHCSADLDQARLLITELVSNAVRYGGPPITVEVECIGPEGVLLSVSDGSDEDPPAPRVADPHALGGRGIHLIDHLSDEWGVQHPHHLAGGQHHHQNGANDASAGVSTGKTVWCRLVPAGIS